MARENGEKEKEIDRLKILLMEKNREAEKWKELCLKQGEEIKSLQGSQVQQHSKQLIQTLYTRFASFQRRLQSLSDDVAQLKAEKKYYGREILDNPFKPGFDDQDYNTACHYAESDHPDEYGAQGMYPYR